MFVTVLSAGLTIGSAIWGQVATIAGLPLAHFIAAGGALIAIPLTWRWKLQTGADLDLTPSMKWPAPITTHENRTRSRTGTRNDGVRHRSGAARSVPEGDRRIGTRAPPRRRLRLGSIRGSGE